MNEAQRITSMFKKSTLDTKMNDMAHASIHELQKNISKAVLISRSAIQEYLQKRIIENTQQYKEQTLSSMSRKTRSKITDTQHATQHVTQYTNLPRNNTQKKCVQSSTKKRGQTFHLQTAPGGKQS